MNSEFPKRCTKCSKMISETEWQNLKSSGFEKDGDVVVLELRDCSCGSTLALCLDPELLSILAEVQAQQITRKAA